MRLEWNQSGLDNLLEEVLVGVSGDYQQMFDRVGRQYKGRPLVEVKGALRREWAKIGGQITDPELTNYAQHIIEGTRIKVRVR